MMNSFEFDFSGLGIGEESIMKYLGPEEASLNYEFRDLIKELLGKASAVCSPAAEYRIFPAGEWNDEAKTVSPGGVVFRLKDIVYKQLSLAESLAVFLCTAGPEVEKLGRKAMEDGDPMTSYIYDIIGSAIAEATSRMLHAEVRKAAGNSGLKVTNRYSPGYCGWDVSDQHSLFRLMPDNTCGISLNDSALMNPEKSVSGIIGIGREVSFDPYPCRFCRMKQCLYRNTM